MTGFEDRFDAWLNKYPRLDQLYTRYYMRVATPYYHAKRAIPDWLERRKWTPGIFYLDHGTEPCVLVRLYNKDTLAGISLVDGRSISGCSIYSCGPERVTETEARQIAETMRTMKEAAE